VAFVLVIQGPDAQTREFALAPGETSVGRDPASALVLDGRGVSRRHAKLTIKGDTLTLADLGSTYGTRVNDAITTLKELRAGDRITIGLYQLTVKRCPDQAVSPSELLSAQEEQEEPEHFSEEVTEAPPTNVHQRKTIQWNREAIQFVLDNPDDEGRAVSVLPKRDSSLMKAVRRIESSSDIKAARAAVRADDEEGCGADYQALLLMYKVSELLTRATTLDEFVEPMADMVLKEVQADTVVMFMLGMDSELVPRVIRHRGSLHAGEVPVSRSIVDRVVQNRATVISNEVGDDSGIPPTQSVLLYNIKAVVAVPLMLAGEVKGVLYLSRSLVRPFEPAEGELVAALASLVASGIERAGLRERVVHERQQRRALERFHPPEVVEELVRGGMGEVSLREHHATVLVCDIQGFDLLVNRVGPRNLAEVLHEYYEMLYEKIFANGGSLVKLHEAWALALFGTAQSAGRDATWADDSARVLCEEFASLAALWPASQNLALRTALDTGPVTSGVVGPIDRLEYTALGTSIAAATAIASRASGTTISITSRTWNELPKQRYAVDPVGAVGEVEVYTLRCQGGGRKCPPS
jgi:class 3 adenylate cyclase/pSer/pThr/pTyr-binding forkhead associated (FHA) protein